MANSRVLVVLFGAFMVLTKADTILRLKRGKYVDQFFDLLSNYPLPNQYLGNELTVFAPVDSAFNETSYKGPKDENMILNHMVNVIVNLGDSSTYNNEVTRISSMLPGSPPLWMTKHENEFYVNGARVIMRNLQATSESGKRQRLHIINRVLEPLAPMNQDSSSAYVDLTAGKLLRDSSVYNIGENSIKDFANQVNAEDQLGLYDKQGTHTFFVPIDSAFKNLSLALVEKDVIAGHVVLGKMLFTQPALSKEEKTATYENRNGIKVTAVVEPGNPQEESERGKVYVKSNTVTGSRYHPREHVRVEIVKANIPVANGVVHLIKRPLIIVALNLWDYLQNEMDNSGRLSKFAEYVSRYGESGTSGRLDEVIRSVQSGTVFAPSNEAFERLEQEMGADEFKRMMETQGATILGMHFLDQRIPAQDIRISNPQNDIKMFGMDVTFPENKGDKIWFYNKDEEDTASAKKLIIDGNGVAAEVIEQDIGATNGVIHVVNKVLGIASQSITEKLAMDPMLSSTYALGQQNHLNDEFQPDQKYTYLVPSNQAWEVLNQKLTSVHKILFMGQFSYQTNQILERHLRIGQELTASEMVAQTDHMGGIEMLRGLNPLRFKHVTDSDGKTHTIVQWEDLEARLIRPNLKCTNGYIHVIDKVLLKRRDVTLGGGNGATSFDNHHLSFLVTATLLLYTSSISL